MSEPREFLTADEIAAEVSATHDVDVDCALATLKQLSDWLGTDADKLIRMTPAPCLNVRRYATGGTIPELRPNDDRIPARLSECGYLISGEPADDDDPAATA